MAPAKGHVSTKTSAALNLLQGQCLMDFSSAGTSIQSSKFSVLGKAEDYSENRDVVPIPLLDEKPKGEYTCLPSDLFHCFAKS